MNLDISLIDQIIQGLYSVCFIYLMCANLLPVIDILRLIPKKFIKDQSNDITEQSPRSSENSNSGSL